MRPVATIIRPAAMKRLIVYLLLFPSVCVLFLIALGLARSGARHLLFVSAAAFVLMLLPAIVVWAVDRMTGQTVWCVIAGLITVPLAIDVALYAVANPRVLESIYFGIAGASAAAACRTAAAYPARSNERPETAGEI
jgi:hypothetical protein